jgi:hypothetical protein
LTPIFSYPVNMIIMPDQNYFDVLKAKLRWSGAQWRAMVSLAVCRSQSAPDQNRSPAPD